MGCGKGLTLQARTKASAHALFGLVDLRALARGDRGLELVVAPPRQSAGVKRRHAVDALSDRMVVGDLECVLEVGRLQSATSGRCCDHREDPRFRYGSA
jgi:hypothetical protein